MPGLSKDYYKHLPMPLRTSRSHFGSLLLGRFSDWFDLIGLFSEAIQSLLFTSLPAVLLPSLSFWLMLFRSFSRVARCILNGILYTLITLCSATLTRM